jgi:flagellar export protein FliJ
MTRRSRLDVVLRLARADEQRALQSLGEARRHADTLERTRDELLSARTRTRQDMALTPGTRVNAGWIRSGSDHLEALASQLPAIEVELASADARQQAARSSVAQQKLRVRALEKAIERRAVRERTLQLRRETRRLDDQVRARQEADHADS